MQFVSLISGLHSSDAEQSAEDLCSANDKLSHLHALLEDSIFKSEIEGMVPKAHYDQERETSRVERQVYSTRCPMPSSKRVVSRTATHTHTN